MKQILFGTVIIPFALFCLIAFNMENHSGNEFHMENNVIRSGEEKHDDTIYTTAGIVRSNETMESIFNKYNLSKIDLSMIYHTSKKYYNLSKLSIGDIYSFEIDKEKNTVQSMRYGIDDMSFLNVVRKQEGFKAEKISLQLSKRIGSLYITIKDSLVLSMPNAHREYRRLAQDLSDIYAWDIDFSNDIRDGDIVKIIVEELWIGEVFRGYGNILAAEFINNGKIHAAYRFELNGYVDYYNSNGKSLKKSLLRSPLKFKYISSRFSRKRLHPKLRVYKPHLGVDYAASPGTPVSAAGSGTVLFAGYKGKNGKMVKIRHNRGFITYYGHLSRIPGKIRKGSKVSQGDIIGYVGSTGLATGPHLDYRIRHNGNFVNPLKIRLPRGKSVPDNLVANFREIVNSFNSALASLTRPTIALKDTKKSTI